MQCVGIRGRVECYADDTQIYMPYKKKDSLSIMLILYCLEDKKNMDGPQLPKQNENKMMIVGGST